jgi:flagellar biosynthetic protein FliP
MTRAASLALLALALLAPLEAIAQSAGDVILPGISISLENAPEGREGVATAIRILVGLTVLSLAPAILVMMTSFTRIVVVLSILRHAFGMQQTPPNTVLIGLALFLTLFNMTPVFQGVADNALTPYLKGELETGPALEQAVAPMRDFMVRQTREEDLALMVELSGASFPNTIEEVSTASLIPAFLLSELRMAFQIGFVIFLPFLLIDIVVASLLMSMGMLMVPPMMLSLPLKVLMFVLIDGWNLVVRSLMSSFA